MKLFKSIRFTIIVPPFFLFLIIVILALVIGNKFFKDSLNNRVTTKLNAEQERLQGNVQFHMEQISKTALLFSSMRMVKENFTACRFTSNQDTCNILFGKELENLSGEFNSDLNFYLANGNLVYANHHRSQLKDEDLVLFKKVVKSGELTNFMGNFSGDLRLISLAPVMSSGKVVGMVTVSNPFSVLAGQFYLPTGEEFLLNDNLGRLVYQSAFDGNDFKKLQRDFNSNVNDIFSFRNFMVIPIAIRNQNNEKIAQAFLFTDMTHEQAFLSKFLYYLILFGVGAFIFGGFIYAYGMSKTIVTPINMLREKILQVAKGEPAEELHLKRKDEIGDMVGAVNILVKSQKNIADFVSKIGTGEFDEDFTPLSQNDQFGNALLLEMRNNLINAKEQEELRKQEDEHRRWAAEGLAKFGEILRQNNDDVKKLGDEIIRNLVHYVDVVQGGLFILNDDDKEDIILELISAYAYDRKKFMEKQIKLGEGLVGTCAIEKLPIYMTDVPDDYVEITSGLGNANPRSILLMPLKIEEDVFGVIELAGFNELEPYKQEFVEKLSESIASTLNAVKINVRTSHLLEQSQQQAEELAAQEEEMRQNMEELQATQEEARRRELELNNIVGAIDGSFVRMELDKKRKIILSNKKLTEVLGFSAKEMKGKDFIALLDNEQHAEFEDLWNLVLGGEYKGGIYNVKDKKGGTIKSYLVFSPVLSESGNVQKVIIVQNILI